MHSYVHGPLQVHSEPEAHPGQLRIVEQHSLTRIAAGPKAAWVSNGKAITSCLIRFAKNGASIASRFASNPTSLSGRPNRHCQRSPSRRMEETPMLIAHLLRVTVVSLFVSITVGCLSATTYAQTKPKRTDVGGATPNSILWVGNSFFY